MLQPCSRCQRPLTPTTQKPETPGNDDVRGADVSNLSGFKMFRDVMFWRNKVGQ